ncbi:response regulator transcription factor [Clostridium frigidicarnis]|uniref:Stage 0 sporulation protein A homolog n=1 Tax=Clostridium frigidicarnis TaxID=84698 RepID=A0A1I1AGI6_9CLOT|nr:response regulator transcription factor [Clostridium frigidicarnis]SFB36602.1 DNA-binding response regulator, OmpR family, contains REC and winged-helix (wHTH) domain [Clostridium frigidicarnis]
MRKKNVLIVEDEVKINKMMSDYFKHEGFNTINGFNGIDGIELFNQNNIDIIILDVMLPKLDGFTVLRRIRKKSDVPVIMVTARVEDEDILMGYELKVDDYITKPFNMEILVAKVKVILDRIIGRYDDEKNIIELNGIKLDKKKYKVFIDEEEIEIEPKQFEILQFLMENKNIVISREKLLETKWGYDYYGNIRVVDAQIKKIRRSLKYKSYCIKTVFGVGYKFDVE